MDLSGGKRMVAPDMQRDDAYAPRTVPLTDPAGLGVLRRRRAAIANHAPYSIESGVPAVSGAAVERPGEGVRPPFSLIGTKETAP